MLPRPQSVYSTPASTVAALEDARLLWAADPDTASRQLRDEVLRMLQAGNYKTPVLPQAAVEALKLVKNPRADLDRIQRLVAADPPLAAKLLSLANSPAYRGLEPFQSLRAALVRLGLSHTQEVLAQAILASHVFNVPHFQARMAEMATESAGVALCCTMLSERDGDADGQAFLAGLVHDLGKAILLQILARIPAGLAAPDEALTQFIEAEHADAGREAGKRMRLANSVITAIALHHQWRADTPSDLPAVLVSLGRRVWHASAEPTPPTGDAWPEIAQLKLHDDQVGPLIDRIRRLRPRLLAMGSMLESDLAR